ncbi:MAG: type I-E CRISPR-associated protein Cas7/Cse4/CasC [Ferrovum sp.]|jgi:CRISPR system Cascade subunit CasC|nr:type I-E CRISPR-associated protein Cas7/Cse4/CasC [Ferrovum sp.]
MSLPRFIQIHTLHTYPAALLNRDDAGLAKRLPLGGTVRTRISSQCLKRHWRFPIHASVQASFDDMVNLQKQFPYSIQNLDQPGAFRSREFVQRIQELLLANNITPELADIFSATLRDAFKKGLDKLIKEAKKPAKKKKGKADATEVESEDAEDSDDGKMQAILLGVPEYQHLTNICIEVAASISDVTTARLILLERLKTEKANFEQMPLNCGMESALFGRMVTSDILASRDAAIYVAHAFTVHKQEVENDYFTVVDDLLRDSGELGSAGIFDTELASGLYYGYVVVDVPQLVENLEAIAAKDCFVEGTPTERRELAGRVVQHLLHLIATVSPGAKRGSTAPFDWAKFMLVEVGDWQPRSLAGAFYDALPLEDKTHAGTIRQRAVTRMTQEISAMDEAYGAPLARRFLALDTVDVPGAERVNLTKLGEWANEIVRQGAC